MFRKQTGHQLTYKHKLKVKQDQPLFARNYPIPMAYRDKVDVGIKRMLTTGVINIKQPLYQSVGNSGEKGRCGETMFGSSKIERDSRRGLRVSQIR